MKCGAVWHPQTGWKRFKVIRVSENRRQRKPTRSLWRGRRRSKEVLLMTVKKALADANREYERRFHRIFIVCATGKSATEILSILQHRLNNDAETELREATEQQRQITEIRLRKWLQG